MMNKQLLKFYKENKKSVIVFTISILILFIVLLYFNSKIILGCKFEHGYHVYSNLRKEHKNLEDIIIEINTLFKTVKTNSVSNFSNEITEDGFGTTISVVDIQKTNIKFSHHSDNKKLDKTGRSSSDLDYSLNRLTGQLRIFHQLLGGEYEKFGEDFFICSEGNKKF